MKNQAYQISQYGNYPDLTKVRKILVVKMRHLGDVLLATPVFSCLKNAIPQAQIDALIYADTFSMLQANPFISKFHLYQRSGGSLFNKFKNDCLLYRKIRKEKYDLVINLTEGDRGALTAFFSNASIKVGFKGLKKGFIGKEKIFTHLVKTPHLPRHIVEVNLDALRRIGIFPNDLEKELYFHIPASAKEQIECLLEKNNIQNQPFVVMHMASRWKFKCWNEESAGRLIDELSKRGFKVILTSSNDPSEKAQIARIEKLSNSLPLNFSGLLSLKELGALIEKASALITVDSVPLHMASALKKPSIVLFGPSSEIIWGPWQNPLAEVVRYDISCRPCGLDGCGGSKKSDCLERISVKQVVTVLDKIKLFC